MFLSTSTVGWLAAMTAVVGLAWSRAATAAQLPETLTGLDGTPLSTDEWSGRVVLFVNVASECGFTDQYAGLQDLHETFADAGLVVVGVPCNQFGGQEPGAADDIQQFCKLNYGVSFPLLEKQEVNGAGRSALYQFLIGGGTRVLWNFEKFLVGRDGTVLKRFRSTTAPDKRKLIKAIEKALADGG